MLGTVTLIGSGELSPSMGKVHRAILSRIEGQVRATFLDTPAGFQLNVDDISFKAAAYLEKHLSQTLSVASFKSAGCLKPAELADAIQILGSANYIFAGPGSPTYAVRNWRDTAIFSMLAQRLASGAHLVFASAAAIALGRHTLPVYEIYKVGEAPHWVTGLDLLGSYGLELAIVPHWNNTEGGTHDTRFCFMGEPRLTMLECLLPDSAYILGIDEYTACILDLDSREAQVLGAGQVTVRHRSRERHYPAGTRFSLDLIDRSGEPAQPARPAGDLPKIPAEVSSQEPVRPSTGDDSRAKLVPLVDLIVWLRAQLRVGQQWELADEIRDRLSDVGIALEDGPDDTSWRVD